MPTRTRVLAVFLLLLSTTLAACLVDMEYARPGRPLTPHAGKTLVFSRVRFFYDDIEVFPWRAPSLADVMLHSDAAERHVWLRRLDVTEASGELQPDKDGSLAIWLPPGDYALLGSEQDPASGGPVGMQVVALLRVPRDPPAVYAGELVFRDEYVEGWHGRYTFGHGSVTTDSLAAAVERLERTYGALAGPPSVSAWCVGPQLPSFKDPGLVTKARQLLDLDCPVQAAP
ncbi:MAG TPA: hypothetical protein VF851_06920 [Steroidobacteraceae bacterium]